MFHASIHDLVQQLEEWIEQTELEIVYDIIKLSKNIKDKKCFLYYFSIFYDHNR